MLLNDSGEPECYEEALQVEAKDKWKLVINNKMESLMKNQTWDLLSGPKMKKPCIQMSLSVEGGEWRH